MIRPTAVALACMVGTAAFAGEPLVQVERDTVNDAIRVRATMEIAASPAVVYAVLTDCERAPQIVPNLESCRIVQRDPAGRYDIRESVISVMLLPRIRTISRNDFEPPKRIKFKRISGDMRISEGEWRLEPLASSKATRLQYSGLFAPDFSVPGFLIENAAARDFPAWLRAIERVSLADGARR